MARTQKATGTAVANWDEELAKQAEAAAGMEQNAGGGQFFGLKGGQLTFNGAQMPKNQMAVVILDHVLENVFYEGEYDPDSPASPTCFAFGRDEKSMEPHKLVVEGGNQQSDGCAGCPMNEWGSAERGRGKACRNTRRLALIPAGTFNDAGKFLPNDDVDHYETAGLAYMKLPVTSVGGWATFVKQVAGALRRPPHGIFTKVTVVPDPKTQFKVQFEPIGPVPNGLMAAVMKRHQEASTVIEFPYTPIDPDAAKATKQQARGRGREVPQRGKAKPATRGGRAKY